MPTSKPILYGCVSKSSETTNKKQVEQYSLKQSTIAVTTKNFHRNDLGMIKNTEKFGCQKDNKNEFNDLSSVLVGQLKKIPCKM